MNIRKTSNATSLFRKQDSTIQVVPSRFTDEDLLNAYGEFLSGNKSLDYEFRQKMKALLDEQVISNNVYQAYHSAKASYTVEIKAKCKSGSNLDIIKNTFAKMISDHYPNLENKVEDHYDQRKRILTVTFQSGALKNYYEEQVLKDLVLVNEQAGELQNPTEGESFEIVGLLLNNRQLRKRIDHDLALQNKELVKTKFRSYDYHIKSIKVKDVTLKQSRYVLVPSLRVILEDEFFALINRVNRKVTLDVSNMPISVNVKYSLLELTNYDRFNTTMLFVFYLLFVGFGLFRPFMMVNESFKLGFNIFLSLGVCLSVGAIVGFIRSVAYSRSHRINIGILAEAYEAGEYENLKTKRRDKKTILIIFTIVIAVLALVVAIDTFINFN